MKKIILPVAIAFAVASCNNSADKTADNKDTMNHDAHTTSTSVEMPAMPEIPTDAKVFFANLKDGQEVKSPLKIEMGVMSLSVDTANGKLKPASGHHHVLIDIDSIPTKETIKPTDSVRIYHFGKAQTSGEINLTPGKHTLTLQFADALHRSYGNRLTHKVTVDVKQ